MPEYNVQPCRIIHGDLIDGALIGDAEAVVEALDKRCDHSACDQQGDDKLAELAGFDGGDDGEAVGGEVIDFGDGLRADEVAAVAE